MGRVPERRTMPDVRQRVNEIAANYERLTRRLAWVTGLQCLYIVAVTLVLALLVASNGHRASENRALIRDVNAERHRNIVQACRETRRRHDRTVAELDRRLAVAVRRAPPAQVERIRESRAFTVALLDDLAPPRADCEAFAAEQVARR
jgi:hypothetical protein